MIDEAIRLAVPAITLGYKVSNDNYGKLLFENSEYSIYYRDSTWYVIGLDGSCCEYSDLMRALQSCAIDAGS